MKLSETKLETYQKFIIYMGIYIIFLLKLYDSDTFLGWG
jgi:hypothetical protein